MATYQAKQAADEGYGYYSTYYKCQTTLDFLEELWTAMKDRDIVFHKREETVIDYDLLNKI